MKQIKILIACISIHALLAESDDISKQRMQAQALFLSTLSLRRATKVDARNVLFGKKISIHALLAESDGIAPHPKACKADFYPRSPCGERQ